MVGTDVSSRVSGMPAPTSTGPAAASAVDRYLSQLLAIGCFEGCPEIGAREHVRVDASSVPPLGHAAYL